jgi:hypothetical protein
MSKEGIEQECPKCGTLCTAQGDSYTPINESDGWTLEEVHRALFVALKDAGITDLEQIRRSIIAGLESLPDGSDGDKDV